MVMVMVKKEQPFYFGRAVLLKPSTTANITQITKLNFIYYFSR